MFLLLQHHYGHHRENENKFHDTLLRVRVFYLIYLFHILLFRCDTKKNILSQIKMML